MEKSKALQKIEKVAQDYGVNNGRASVILAAERSFVTKTFLGNKIKNINKIQKLSENATEQEQAHYQTQINALKYSNAQAVDDILNYSFNNTLMANELNTGLVNIIGDIYVNDGLDVLDRYAVFNRTDSEFGQLNLIYGLDVLNIITWTGQWTVDNQNPDFVKNNVNKIDSLGMITIQYKNNASVYKGAFNTSGESIEYIAAENKKSVDTEIVHFNAVHKTEIENAVTIGVHIAGFDTDANTTESVDTINATILDMQNEQVRYNEVAFRRATKKDNLVLIAGKKFYSKTARDLANRFNKDEIDTKLGIYNKILENELSTDDKVIIVANTFYNKNKRTDITLSEVQAQTSNTVNYRHVNVRVGIANDQQAVMFDPAVLLLQGFNLIIENDNLVFNYEKIGENALIEIEIINIKNGKKNVITNKTFDNVEKTTNKNIISSKQLPEKFILKVKDLNTTLTIFQESFILNKIQKKAQDNGIVKVNGVSRANLIIQIKEKMELDKIEKVDEKPENDKQENETKQ